MSGKKQQINYGKSIRISRRATQITKNARRIRKNKKKSGLKKRFVCDRMFVKRNGQEKEDDTWRKKEN